MRTLVGVYVELSDVLMGDYLIRADVCHLEGRRVPGLDLVHDPPSDDTLGNDGLPKADFIGDEHSPLAILE